LEIERARGLHVVSGHVRFGPSAYSASMRVVPAVTVAVQLALLGAPLLAAASAARAAGADSSSAPAGAAAAPPGEATSQSSKRDVAKKKKAAATAVGDPIGVLHNPPAAARAAKSSAGGKGPTIAELQSELEELRARTAGLEQEQRESRAQARLLNQMSEQLRAISSQLAEAQESRGASAAAAAAQSDETQAAIDRLGGALSRLASGNDDVGDALDAAEQAFPPQARRDLAGARDALQTRNLSLARGFILAAINDAQAGR